MPHDIRWSFLAFKNSWCYVSCIWIFFFSSSFFFFFPSLKNLLLAVAGNIFKMGLWSLHFFLHSDKLLQKTLKKYNMILGPAVKDICLFPATALQDKMQAGGLTVHSKVPGWFLIFVVLPCKASWLIRKSVGTSISDIVYFL